MNRAAEQMDPPAKGLRMIIEQSANVRLPEPALLRRKGGQINQVARIYARQFRGGPLLKPAQLFLQHRPFPMEKLAPLHWAPIADITSPIQEVSQEAPAPHSRPL